MRGIGWEGRGGGKWGLRARKTVGRKDGDKAEGREREYGKTNTGVKEILSNMQRDRKINRQLDGRMDRRTDRQTDKKTDIQLDT